MREQSKDCNKLNSDFVDGCESKFKHGEKGTPCNVAVETASGKVKKVKRRKTGVSEKIVTVGIPTINDEDIWALFNIVEATIVDELETEDSGSNSVIPRNAEHFMVDSNAVNGICGTAKRVRCDYEE